ncbi:MAG: hypothetical protein JWN76_1614 [Chitinophagaceae bacterium]|nr:hypothetical protein [Chitinophagaceae bacterium]
MIFQTYSPIAPLNHFINHFTYYRHYDCLHAINRFLPDGNTEIIIDLTGTPKFIYDNVSLQTIQECKKVWISGFRKKFITIPSGRDMEMFIINFKKGMVYPFLGIPLSEITDRVVDGDLILNPMFAELRNQLHECASADTMFHVAETKLLKNFPGITGNPVVQYAVRRIMAVPEMTSIKEVAEKTGYSSKHLIHLFEQQVGTSPKIFLRIIRFQKAISEINCKKEINFARLAIDCGYYDQSHFILDFKSFSGFTPLDYMKRKNDQMNYVPIQ